MSQQKESMPHTHASHAQPGQPGVGVGRQPFAGQLAWQEESAMPTQVESHAESQQTASRAHTHASMAWSLAPGVARDAQGSPAHEPHWSAAAAQAGPQATVQQSGIWAQTQSWTRGSMQPWAWCSRQQVSAHPPQSTQQVAQDSVGSHRPSPQTLPQTASHCPVAMATQAASHVSVQQNGSAAQVQASMVSSAAPGELCAWQTSPLQVAQLSARAAQAASQIVEQHEALTMQTHSWTAGSMQPGVAFPTQQLPVHNPQSAGQEEQISFPLHMPSPQ